MSAASEGSLRHRLLKLGVRQKIVLILLAALLVSLTANTWLALQSRERDILNETNRRGQEISALVAQNLANSVLTYNYHAIELLLQELIKNEDIVYLRVLSAKGNTMAEVREPGYDPARLVTFRQDIHIEKDRVGQLLLGLSTERIVHNLEQERTSSVWRQIAIILLVLAAELAALSYLIIRPIATIRHAIRENVNEQGEITRPITLESIDEFGDMARQFNLLREHLNEANIKLRSKVDLANDELKRANEQLRGQAEDLKHMNRELQVLSVTDPLTGLYNRRYFEMLMESEVALSVRNDETISILLIDIDHFKACNERYGHTAADEVLKTVAQLIHSRVRKSDIACRYGGDEFFVLCRRATIANVIAIADDLQQSLAQRHIRHEDQELRVTLSIGAATIPGVHAVHSAVDFFKCADQALFHCKQRGRNGVVHYAMLERDHKTASNS
jgi:diguanylate cyclase (GGDEF)-like protein